MVPMEPAPRIGAVTGRGGTLETLMHCKGA